MAARKTVLVFGATGKQGGAVIQHLLEQQSNPPLDIVAVTRSKASHSAQALASKPNVSVVEGNLDDPSAIFQQLPSVWGVFSVQVNSDAEEKQGKAVVCIALLRPFQRLAGSWHIPC